LGYNETINQEKERLYLYLGDELGYIKIWDIMSIIDCHPELEKARRLVDTRSFFNPYRQEQVDCSKYVNQLRESLAS